MSSKENYHKARHARRRSCLPSCFSGSFLPDGLESTSAPVPEPAVAASSSWSSRSWFGKKKKTMPAAADVPTNPIPAGHGDKDNKLCKSKSDKARSQPRVQRQQEAIINAGSQTARTGRTAATAGETDRRTARLDPVFGLLIVALTLAVMLVCGRACAVAALCACFYLVPLLTPAAARTTEGEIRGKTVAAKIDVDSAEYKKRVVLEGLLDRSGRRLSGLSSRK